MSPSRNDLVRVPDPSPDCYLVLEMSPIADEKSKLPVPFFVFLKIDKYFPSFLIMEKMDLFFRKLHFIGLFKN